MDVVVANLRTCSPWHDPRTLHSSMYSHLERRSCKGSEGFFTLKGSPRGATKAATMYLEFLFSDAEDVHTAVRSTQQQQFDYE